MQEEEAPPKQWRSTASSNWREPESSSRPSPPPMRSFQRNNDNRGQSGAAPGTRLYVGNLLYTAQTADVQQFFTENGYNDAKVTMTTDPFTGRNPSYCFVDLSSPEEASKALEQLNGAEVLGRAVRMGPGNSKREGGVQARVKTYERGTGRSESGPSYDNAKPSFDRWTRNDASSNFTAPTQEGKRVYVGGLPLIEPQAAAESAMQELFAGFEIQTVSKIISPHPSKAEEPGNHYYLFVDLVSSDDVTAATRKLDRTESPFGGELRVSRAKDNRDRKVTREQFGDSSRQQSFGDSRQQPGELKSQRSSNPGWR